MRKARHISLNECYAVLELTKDATLDDVKRAYRRRAFELHPDLNADPNAGQQFQDLNEAYVVLTRILETQEEKRRAQEAAEAKRQQERAQREAEREAERRATQEEKNRLREEKEKARLEKEKERQEKARQREEARAKAEAEAKERAKAKAEARQEQDWQKQREEWAERMHSERQRANQAYAKEDVLRDLLDDPFARRVFEDIYSAVNKQGAKAAAEDVQEKTSKAQEQTAKAEETRAKEEKSKAQEEPKKESKPTVTKVEATNATPTAQVTLNDDKGVLHAANSFSSKIMGWFKHQIDDEQTIKMPASHLFVGARIRLQIRRGLSEELSTVEITLPSEFVVGKPLRLRGLGKKVGKWQGDLYLTIESK